MRLGDARSGFLRNCCFDSQYMNFRGRRRPVRRGVREDARRAGVRVGAAGDVAVQRAEAENDGERGKQQ